MESELPADPNCSQILSALKKFLTLEFPLYGRVFSVACHCNAHFDRALCFARMSVNLLHFHGKHLFNLSHLIPVFIIAHTLLNDVLFSYKFKKAYCVCLLRFGGV